jgi:NADPH2:quinone reductase
LGGKVATVSRPLQPYFLTSLRPTQDFLGSHATYVSAPWKWTYPIPTSVSTRTAAAGILQSLTACTFFEEAYKVKKGDTILVHTVAGGLGLLFAQLGKARGATVIGTTSTPAKAEIAKRHGADHVILYPVEDTVKKVLEITGGVGVDAIFDGVGKDTCVCLSFVLLLRGVADAGVLCAGLIIISR